MESYEERQVRRIQTPGTLEHYVNYDLEFLRYNRWFQDYSHMLQLWGGSASVKIESMNTRHIRDISCRRKTVIAVTSPSPDTTIQDVLGEIPDKSVTVMLTIDSTSRSDDSQ